MKAIDIFGRIDFGQYGLLINLIRQRKLHQDAVDMRGLSIAKN